jgi:LacI family transcriptional regulator
MDQRGVVPDVDAPADPSGRPEARAATAPVAALLVPDVPGRSRGHRPTIKDIAALAGVSHSAASRALNGTGYVGARARQRVLEVAAEVGYVPHVTARYLKERVTRAVGVLVDDLRDPTQAALVTAVLAAAREHGLATMLADRVDGAEPGHTGLLDFVAFGVAGVVLVPGPGGSTEYLARYGIPTVEVPLDASADDAAAAGRNAVRRLAADLSVGRARRTR